MPFDKLPNCFLPHPHPCIPLALRSCTLKRAAALSGVGMLGPFQQWPQLSQKVIVELVKVPSKLNHYFIVYSSHT